MQHVLATKHPTLAQSHVYDTDTSFNIYQKQNTTKIFPTFFWNFCYLVSTSFGYNLFRQILTPLNNVVDDSDNKDMENLQVVLQTLAKKCLVIA